MERNVQAGTSCSKIRGSTKDVDGTIESKHSAAPTRRAIYHVRQNVNKGLASRARPHADNTSEQVMRTASEHPSKTRPVMDDYIWRNYDFTSPGVKGKFVKSFNFTI